MSAAAAVALMSGISPARADGCNPSFVVPQPLFRVIAPEDEAVDVPFRSPHLVVATDASDFSFVQHVSLVPETGNPIQLGPSDISSKHQDVGDIQFTSLYGHTAVLGAIRAKTLAPSMTYDVILVVKTYGAPGCPPELTEHVGRFTTESATALDAFG
ncbi:MAG: hypothetical protein JO293_03205, partial [Candidatus Eremiobacteraeota bacterium]|nr:hypothetical protein [Candidatus Eremiobacteraeota bacterium]